MEPNSNHVKTLEEIKSSITKVLSCRLPDRVASDWFETTCKPINQTSAKSVFQNILLNILFTLISINFVQLALILRIEA